MSKEHYHAKWLSMEGPTSGTAVNFNNTEVAKPSYISAPTKEGETRFSSTVYFMTNLFD